MRLIILLTLSLLAVTTAGAAPVPPLHHKSAAGLMPAAYLQSSERALSTQAAAANSGVLEPYAILPLEQPATASAGRGRLAAVSTDEQLLRLGWTDGLTVTQTLPALVAPSGLAVGDLNGDGRSDLLALQRPANKLALAAGSPGGTLAAPTQHDLPADAEALLVDDLTADCRRDAAFTALDGTVQVLPQTADRTLGAARTALFANGGATDLAVGDFNHDGQFDLAALRGTGNTTNHLGLYTIVRDTLTATGERSVADGGFAAHAVASGDVTGDGRADLIVSAGGNQPDAYLNLFAQQPSGLFATTPITMPAWHIPESVAVADVNHDGHNDVIALHSGWLALSLYLNQGDGTLAPYEVYELPYSAAYRPETLTVLDLNEDGGLDVLIADGSRGVTYLLNSDAAPTATIATPIACTRSLGQRLTIGGTVSGASVVEVSLDGGATWEAATVDGTTWSYTAEVGNRPVYKRVMARAVEGERVQAPVAETYLRIFNYQQFVPIVGQ
ncbi:MAG TPA: FG-GAP-like repeat-containing protein [Herpetosiphonaceae bacterium]